MARRSDLLSIPIFQLYGEAEAMIAGPAEAEFVHIETIRARAGLHAWEIRPHRHWDLYQCLLILKGGGTFGSDGVDHAFRAPALLGAPPASVHAFVFDPGAEGYVLTVSEVFLEQVLASGPEPMPPPVWPLASDIRSKRDLDDLAAAFEGLDNEFRGQRTGRVRAIASFLGLILVTANRLALERPATGSQDHHTSLVTALNNLIRTHATEHWGLEAYARRIGVTPRRLNSACRNVVGRSPIQMAHEHLMREARRSLIYTVMTVQEISYTLGFSDPAYFSRFFTLRQGMPPQRFRATRGRPDI